MNLSVRNVKSWLLVLFISLSSAHYASAQGKGIWTGDKITFTKSSYAKWTNAANQDRITDTVWITRKDDQGIFNIRVSGGYSNNSSPVGTRWAFGTTKNLGSLSFNPWETTVSSNPPGMVNKDMVMLLVEDSIYVDVKFTSWASGGSGGGFTYIRSTDCRSFYTLSATTCDSFVSPSKKYVWKKSGEYMDTIPNKAGCDSIITIQLTAYTQDIEKKFFSGCGQVVLPFSKRAITTSGTYNDTLKNGTVCGRDSILIASIYIYKVPTKDLTASACDSFTSPSGKYVWKTSGIYKDVLKAVGTCDTAVTVDLTIYKSKVTQVTDAACDRYVSVTNQVYTSSGNYQDTLQTTTGCDSIIDLTLTINKSALTKSSRSVCNISYTSPSGKYVWGKSGLYRDTLMTSNGCDSVLEINLTVEPFESKLKIESCDPWTSPSKKFTFTQTGVYYDTLTTVDLQCDSIVEIDFTKLEPTASTQTVTAAINRYHAPSGKTVWTTNGTYNDVIPNDAGCDSSITFNLTVIDVSLDVTKTDNVLKAEATGVDYQWLDCNNNYAPVSGETSQSFTVTKKGKYAVRLSNEWNADTSDCIEMNLSADKLQNPFAIQVYPNPNNGQFTIDLSNVSVLNNSVEILTASGKTVFKTNATNTLLNVNLPENTAKGVYLVRITNDLVSYTSMIVVE